MQGPRFCLDRINMDAIAPAVANAPSPPPAALLLPERSREAPPKTDRPRFAKTNVLDLALFGGTPVFAQPRSTSSLEPPDAEAFFRYSRMFFDQRRYTNNGPVVQMLEKRLAAFHHVPHCLSFCSGFWALVLAMRCLALEGRTEVIMPSLTYRRMADVAAWVGLTPHYCEVDPVTMAMTPATAAACINENTALILGVHPIVNCCDAQGLVQMAQRKGIPILFDSVESMYETRSGQKVGSIGVAECFSMHASKLVNGFEGGYVTTSDPKLAHRLEVMRGFGFYGQDNIEELGTNAKLNEVHAAMTLAGLDGLEVQVVKNRARYEYYKDLLHAIPELRLVPFDETERCSYKNILVELEDEWPLARAELIALLNAEGILARAYYSPPLHRKKTSYATIATDLTVTDRLSGRFVLLPCGHFVDDEDTDAIIATLRFARKHAARIQERASRG